MICIVISAIANITVITSMLTVAIHAYPVRDGQNKNKKSVQDRIGDEILT